MKLYFFKHNAQYVIDKVIGNPLAVAFWYSQGLTSYTGIDSVLAIDAVYVEESVFDFFKVDYPDISAKYKIHTFRSNRSRTLRRPYNGVFASNDTHIYLYDNVLRTMQQPWKLLCRKSEVQSAKTAADKFGYVAQETGLKIDDIAQYSSLLMGNDWGPLEQQINHMFLKKGVNTICLQESVLDFNRKDKRMRYCSMPVFQGIETLKSVDLQGKICAVIGNPRYEELNTQPMPNSDRVLLNVNFTWGIYEEAREDWVDDVVEACTDLGLDYAISQHPRDSGNLSRYNVIKTNASSVHLPIIESSLLVTRFSSLIHEALCLGRPVIYYNPHGENLFYNFSPDNKCFFYATTKRELSESITRLLSIKNKNNLQEIINSYLGRHLGVTRKESKAASRYIIELISNVNDFPILRKITFRMGAIAYLKRIKRYVLKEKF